MNEQTVNLLKDITERVGWKLTKKLLVNLLELHL